MLLYHIAVHIQMESNSLEFNSFRYITISLSFVSHGVWQFQHLQTQNSIREWENKSWRFISIGFWLEIGNFWIRNEQEIIGKMKSIQIMCSMRGMTLSIWIWCTIWREYVDFFFDCVWNVYVLRTNKFHNPHSSHFKRQSASVVTYFFFTTRTIFAQCVFFSCTRFYYRNMYLVCLSIHTRKSNRSLTIDAIFAFMANIFIGHSKKKLCKIEMK